MLRERVLQEWKGLKDKVNKWDLELLNYRMCFVIADKNPPKRHDKKKMLVGLELPDRMVTNSHADIQTDLAKEVTTNLIYKYDGKILSAESVVILMSGSDIEEVD